MNQWQKLLEYLPELEKTSDFGRIEMPPGSMPYAVHAKITSEFVKSFYDLGLQVNFDWMKWPEGFELLKLNDFKDCDLLTLQKLLTLIIRRERFVEGSLISAFKSGVIVEILKSASRILPI